MTSYAMIARLASSLEKPIVIFDTESTGLLHEARVGIVEFAFLAVHPDGRVQNGAHLLDPGFPIPPDATRVHGIRDEDVQGARNLPVIAPLIQSLFASSVITGFNSSGYDIPLIRRDFERFGLNFRHPQESLDVRDLWKAVSKSQRGKLMDVAAAYGVRPGTAHRAMGDTLTTAGVLDEMIYRHGADFVMKHGLGVTNRLQVKPSGPTRLRSGEASSDASSTKRDRSYASTAHVMQEGVRERETVKTRLTRAIVEHLEKHGSITPKDYVHLAERCQTTPSSVSFRISEMLKSGEMKPHHAEDRDQQAAIAAHLGQAIQEAGGTDRLKPLKEALDRLTGMDIEYVQLRLAMDRFVLVGDEAVTPSARPSSSMRMGM